MTIELNDSFIDRDTPVPLYHQIATCFQLDHLSSTNNTGVASRPNQFSQFLLFDRR